MTDPNAPKYRYNILLKDPDKQEEVLARHPNCQVASPLEALPGLVAMDLTVAEAKEMQSDDDVSETEWEPEICEELYIPRTKRNLTMFTNTTTNAHGSGYSSTNRGDEHSPMWFHWSSNSPYIGRTIRIDVLVSAVTNSYHLKYPTSNTYASDYSFVELTPGNTYVFNQSHTSNANHPIGFKKGTSVYTTNVSSTGTPGSAGAQTIISPLANDFDGNTPLKIYCEVHGDSYGGDLEVRTPGYFTTSPYNENPVMDNHITTQDGGTRPYPWNGQNTDIEQTVDGRFIDVVAVEAGTPTTSYQGSTDHPDWKSPDGTDRFVPMDWSTIDGNISSSSNTNQSSAAFGSHAIMVLSGVGGKSTGWLKNSSLRVIYLADGITEAWNAVRLFHINKAVNPATGRQNATVVTNSWGWTTYIQGRYGIPVDDIAQINYYGDGTNDESGPDGSVTTVNRPVSGTWGNDFTEFINACYMPRAVRTSSTTYEWMITLPYGVPDTTYRTALTTMKNTNGLYSVKSAGNFAGIYAKINQDRWWNNIVTDNSASYYTLSSGGGYITSTPSSVTVDTQTYYPQRPHGISGLLEWIEVGASQHSTQNRLMDNYSTRGPGVDIMGNGSYSFSAYSSETWADCSSGEYWGQGGGTSIAGPFACGAWGMIIEAYYVTHGHWPTYEQAKSLLIEYSDKDKIADVVTATYSAFVSPSSNPYSSTRLYSSSGLYETQGYYNGGNHLTELVNTPNRFAFVPDSVRLVETQQRKSVRSRKFGTRPTTGQQFPRRKIRLSG